MSTLSIKTVSSIHEVDPAAWDQLSHERPFQSHCWYAYGERVMADCPPTYLLACKGNELVARASLWLVPDEPLPAILGFARKPLQRFLRRWPLLICRSPLSYSTGLILSEQSDRAETLSTLTESALHLARDHQASFVLFDSMSQADILGWPRPFSAMTTPEPGMKLKNRWTSLDEYLASAGKKARQHYKRVLREASKLGIRVERHRQPVQIEKALSLIRNVEREHGGLPNPWARAMLENMDLVNGLFLTAAINDELVGCGLLLEDSGSQMTSILGLAKDTPYVYFMLIYESLKIAFEHKVHSLRWGSGAYEVKQRLGFSPEDNTSLTFTAVNLALQKALQWFG